MRKAGMVIVSALSCLALVAGTASAQPMNGPHKGNFGHGADYAGGGGSPGAPQGNGGLWLESLGECYHNC